MRTPAFWYRPGWSLAAVILLPVSWLWGLGAGLRARRTGVVPPLPVICVGNLTAGGSGKTPLVLALAERLIAQGHRPHIVSRGYGAEVQAVIRVDPARHTAAEVGDEPLLLSHFAPVHVAPTRLSGVVAAKEAGAELVILDDGFQDPSLAPRLNILAVNAARGFGNGLLIPAGPLRESVAIGLGRADLVAVTGAGDFAPVCAAPVVRFRVVPVLGGLDLGGEKVIAFAGIAHPESFFTLLEGLGAQLVSREAFGDHQPLPVALIQRMIAQAQATGAMVVTTEKDAMRLPERLRRELTIVPIRLVTDDWSQIDEIIHEFLAGKSRASTFS